MFPQLFFIAILVAAIEPFFIGFVFGYFQEKIRTKDMLKLIVSSVGIMLYLLLGQIIGRASTGWLGNQSGWFAATIFFALGLKLIYDRIKLSKVKQLINPIETKGLLILTVLAGINVFFIGMASGLLKTNMSWYHIGNIMFLVFLFLGFGLGFKSKKIFSRRFELISAVFYIAIAIIIATNI